MGWLTQEQLEQIGFQYLGQDVKISDKASIHNPQLISIDDHSRIDDFVILSTSGAGLFIGKYVHIGCHSTLIGKSAIVLMDYSGLSSRVAIYSSSDSYDGTYMTNPTLPAHVMNTKHAPVVLGKHVVIGTGSTILPGVTLTNCSVGAMSLVTKSFYDYYMLTGIPARPTKPRSKHYLELEKEI
jgi:dTDP-4-amino-4,6-dideoxy-D-glucose acyltransferase